MNKLLVAVAGLLFATAFAQAKDCSVDPEFKHAYPANDTGNKFKLKFKVSSDDCAESRCEGMIKFRIHYDYDSGDSNSRTTHVLYSIPQGQRSTEVTTETYPSSSSGRIKVRDVEIYDSSCRK
jgi:hypothetical protein